MSEFKGPPNLDEYLEGRGHKYMNYPFLQSFLTRFLYAVTNVANSVKEFRQ